MSRYYFSLTLLFFFMITITGLVNANSQEIPEEFYIISQLYDNNASNAELTLSVDKFIYSPGDLASVLGFVHDFNKGVRVYIQIIDPIGNVRSEINVSPAGDGIFKIQNDIPDDLKPGDYTISAKYGSNGVPILLKVTIHVESIETFVIIPSGSHQLDHDVNYDPRLVIVEAGLPLVWINEDETVHTVISGKIGFNNRMYHDGKFDSGTFGPGNSFSIMLPEGEYDYFCKLHPWLRGFIVVIPSTDLNYVEPVLGAKEIIEKEVEIQNPIVVNAGKDVYLPSENLVIWGFVKNRESNLPVTIQIFDPKKNLIYIDQIVPEINGKFERTIPTLGSAFKNSGIYEIFAQYGVLEFKTNSQFALGTLNLLDSNYKGFEIYELGENFYATPFPEGVYNDIINFINFESLSFEKSDSNLSIPVGWSFAKPQFIVELDTSTKVDGDNSFKLQTNSEKQDWSWVFSRTIPISFGQYLIETNMKWDNVVSSHISIYETNPSGIKLINQLPSEVEGKSDWKNFSWQMNLRENKTAIQFVLNAGWVQDYNLGNATTWFDGLKVCRLIPDLERCPFVLGSESIEDLKEKIALRPQVGPYVIEKNYEGFDIVMYGGDFFALPQNEIFEPQIIEQNGTRDDVLVATTLDEVKMLVNNLLIPKPLFPVSDEVLLEIWNKRTDLQQDFPEVSQGNFESFKIWAKGTGWNEESSLLALIPEGQVPSYLSPLPAEEPEELEIPSEPESVNLNANVMLVIISILVGTGFIFGFKKLLATNISDKKTAI